jgi:DNA polymerase III sliding clamp (beta) subunit (PCNA family)
MSDGEPTTCLVECYWPGVTEQKVLAAVERVQAAIEQRHTLRLLGSILVQADETVFCLFEGEQDEVEAVSTSAELPFERILGSRWIDATRRFPNETNV